MEPNVRNDEIGTLANAILQTVPLMYRRIVRKNEMLEGTNLAYPKIGILLTLKKNGPLPLSAIAQTHSYSRQNLTTLTDNLEAAGLVRRIPDSHDRRVINLELTDAGRNYIRDHGERMKQALIEELNGLEDAEIEELRTSFETIKRIYLKVAEAPKQSSHPG